MVAYLKASLHEKTYSNYLWAAREAEEESMELSQIPQSQVIDNTAKPKTTSFFPAMCLAHLEEESAERDEEVEIEDPDGIDGFMEEFMVCLV